MMDLTTVNDYIWLLNRFKFNLQSYDIVEPRPGTVCICFRKQRFHAWWVRKKLKKFIRNHRPVSIYVELVISLGIA